MDTKLKNNKSKIIITLISLILVIITSIGICKSYPYIEKRVNNKGYSPYESSRFLNDLNDSNNVLYYAIKSNNGDMEPSDLFLNLDERQNTNEDKNMDYFKAVMNSRVDEWSRNLQELKNLDYYVIDNETKIENSRGNNELKSLLEIDKAVNKVNKLKEAYQFYVVMNYDVRGKVTIRDVYGANSEKISNEFFRHQDSFNDVHNGKFMGSIEANIVKNTSFIYAVPKEIKYVDNISRNIEYAKIQSYSMESSVFINYALIFIMVCAILIPYKKLKELVGFNKISKIPFEVNLLLGALAVVFLYGAPEISILRTINMDLEWFFGTTLSGFTIPNLAIGLLNLIYWVICFGIIFIEVIILKHILNKGIKKYAKESMATYKVAKYINNKVKIVYRNFKQIDFRAVNINKLIKVLLINLLILIVMCSFWFFGIILAIIYTIILFIKVRKYSTKISNQYNKLFEATNKIAQGNLDVRIEDDLGIFEPFKDEVEKIQSGFKKAVNEEVKSQRMKTELISNVSHDLKTPLTSIITYVDLLKDENLSEEKRAQYLDTLDRKSQRLQALIEDLFEVSKATSGSINLNIVEVDVVSLMKQTLLELDDKITKSSLILKKNMPQEKVLLQLDSQRMFRVFENLIINITKYAMIGSRVYIDIIDNEECVEIILKNMTAEEIKFNVNEIVERFVRGDKARNTEGSGLGLAIAKSFIELQGGLFEVNIDGDLFKVTMKFNK